MPLRPLTISGTATDAEGREISASVSVSVNEPTLFGSSVLTSDGVNHYDDFDTLFGDIKISRTYCGLNQNPPKYASQLAAQDAAHGAASATSFKYYPSDVLSGSKDAIIGSIFSSMQPGAVRWWSYWHEPDDEIYVSSTFTSADYLAAWNHINELSAAYTPAGVDARAYTCVMEYSMRPADKHGPQSPRPFEGMYPGDFIQALGFDVYSGWNDKNPYTLDPAEQFDKLFALGQQYGKPICLPEFGTAATAPSGVSMTRAQWITNALRYMEPHADEISFITYWNDGFAILTDDTAAASVWKGMCLNGWAGTP